MHKVVTERRRRNPGPDKGGRRANLPDELLPKVEGIARPHQNRKWSRKLFGPLHRWLQSQVGRPWNDVYSEACAVLKADCAVRADVKARLLEYVERSAFMHKGVVCVLRGRFQEPVPLTEGRWRRDSFYVHPETGLLQPLAQVSRRTRLMRSMQKPETFRWLNSGMAFRQIRGLWFECTFARVPPRTVGRLYDHAYERELSSSELYSHYHRAIVCVRKRQLSHQSLRKNGLANLAGSPFPRAQVSDGFFGCRLKFALIFRRAADYGFSWTRQYRCKSDPSLATVVQLSAHRATPWSLSCPPSAFWPCASTLMGRSCGLSRVIGSNPVAGSRCRPSSMVEQPRLVGG